MNTKMSRKFCANKEGAKNRLRKKWTTAASRSRRSSSNASACPRCPSTNLNRCEATCLYGKMKANRSAVECVGYLCAYHHSTSNPMIEIATSASGQRLRMDRRGMAVRSNAVSSMAPHGRDARAALFPTKHRLPLEDSRTCRSQVRSRANRGLWLLHSGKR